MGSLLGHLLEPLGHLGHKGLPKVPRRLPKGPVEILKLPRRAPFWGRFWGGAVF